MENKIIADDLFTGHVWFTTVHPNIYTTADVHYKEVPVNAVMIDVAKRYALYEAGHEVIGQIRISDKDQIDFFGPVVDGSHVYEFVRTKSMPNGDDKYIVYHVNIDTAEVIEINK